MKRIFVVPLLVFLGASSASAAGAGFDFTQLGFATNAAVKALLTTIAIGADHRPYASASPLGYAVGLDIGVDTTVIAVPREFTDALTSMGNRANLPPSIPLPKLNIRKGLPGGVDIGLSWIGYQKYRIIGTDVQWAFVQGSEKLPAFAIRASANWANLDVAHTKTYSFDLVTSKGFGFFEPYLGTGIQFASGDLAVGGLPVDVSGSQKSAPMRFFVGVPIKMSTLHLTPEYQYSFAGFSTYGAKFSFSL